MALFLRALDKEVDELHGNGVRLRFIGDLDALRRALAQAHARRRWRAPRATTALQLNIAVNYGGRWDIVQASRQAAAAVAAASCASTRSTRHAWASG